MQIADLFSERISAFQNQLISAQHKSNLIGWIRTLVFLSLIYSIYLLLDSKDTRFLIVIGILVLLFGLLIIYHQKTKHAAGLLAAKVKINEEELARTKGDFDLKKNGEHYIDASHPYSADLDLFGTRSLFHHINRTESHEGDFNLSKALVRPLTKEEACDRQGAIKTLIPQLDWRQSWQAVLRVNAKEEDKVTTGLVFPSTVHTWQIMLSIGLSVIALGLMIAWLFFGLPFQIFIGIMPVNLTFLVLFQRTLTDFGFKSSSFVRKLEGYIQVLKLINELDSSRSQLLMNYQKNLGPEAADAWRILSQLIYGLDSRANILYWILNPIFFIDILLQQHLALWHEKHGMQLPDWLKAVHEMEVLISMAGYAQLHQDYVFPELSEETIEFNAHELGHPLIAGDQAVTNDYVFGKEKLSLITGSNMSGKSTFLRTVGIAHVMAWTGLPVKAKALRLSRFDLFTSMRTADDINENTSSFYAELKRIKLLLDNLQQSPEFPVLYFLDEILKGTNSHDRHKGAAGLIEKLIRTNSYGFISTHDLELAVEFDQHPSVKNYSFNSTLINNQLDFSYKISNTICQSANASKLMSIMGIIPDEKE